MQRHETGAPGIEFDVRAEKFLRRPRRQAGNAGVAAGECIAEFAGHRDGMNGGFAERGAGLRKCQVELIQPLPQRAGNADSARDAAILGARPFEMRAANVPADKGLHVA